MGPQKINLGHMCKPASKYLNLALEYSKDVGILQLYEREDKSKLFTTLKYSSKDMRILQSYQREDKSKLPTCTCLDAMLLKECKMDFAFSSCNHWCCRLYTHLGNVEEIFNPLGVSLGASLESRCCHLILNSSV
jgi:hypothetical protein